CLCLLILRACNLIILNSEDFVLVMEKRSNDVALLSGFTSNNSSPSDDNTKLKIAIVGFGNFGQFLAKTIVSQAHGVLAYSRSDYSNVAGSWGF
ncbi:hypothetical protein S245_056384, partial [Arachis hypogaea]